MSDSVPNSLAVKKLARNMFTAIRCKLKNSRDAKIQEPDPPLHPIGVGDLENGETLEMFEEQWNSFLAKDPEHYRWIRTTTKRDARILEYLYQEFSRVALQEAARTVTSTAALHVNELVRQLTIDIPYEVLESSAMKILRGNQRRFLYQRVFGARQSLELQEITGADLDEGESLVAIRQLWDEWMGSHASLSRFVLRTEKLTTIDSIIGSGDNELRERSIEHGESNHTHLNEPIGILNTAVLIEGIQARLNCAKSVRKNSVLALKYFISASPEWFRTASEEQWQCYFDDAEQWLKSRHGTENVVAVNRRYDDAPPVLCAYVVPIDPSGKLNCSFFQDGRDKLQQMQAEFGEKVGARYGLENGREECFVNSPTPQPSSKESMAPTKSVSATPMENKSLVGCADRCKSGGITGAARKNTDDDFSPQSEFEHAKLYQSDFHQREQVARGAALGRLRQIDLALVLERFGALKDASDKKNWLTQWGRITVTGSKFFNHRMNCGGGGAIDLLMHLNGCDFKVAMQWLAAEFGAGAMPSQIGANVLPKIETVARAPAGPFVLPPASTEHWHVVRDYLHQVRKFSFEVIDTLNLQGKLYADSCRNCVFVFDQDKGVELRGTSDRSFHGMRGLKTGFFIRNGADDIKKIAFVESSIDAVSLYELAIFEGLIVAVGGNATTMSRDMADQYRGIGYTIFAASDNDKGGDAQAAALGQATRLRPSLKDWNADLVEFKTSTSV